MLALCLEQFGNRHKAKDAVTIGFWFKDHVRLPRRIENSNARLDKLGNAARPVPVRHINISAAVDEATMSRTEDRGRYIVRRQRIVGPLRLLWIVAEERYWSVVSVKDGDAAFQLGDHRILPVKTDLAGPPQMQSDGAHKLSVEIKMAKTAVFPIRHQQ